MKSCNGICKQSSFVEYYGVIFTDKDILYDDELRKVQHFSRFGYKKCKKCDAIITKNIPNGATLSRCPCCNIPLRSSIRYGPSPTFVKEINIASLFTEII